MVLDQVNILLVICLIHLIEEITTSLDLRNYVVSLFLDLSKAFDTVNHHILLEKLNYYGLQHYKVNWFRSYLCSRKHQVYINGVKSDFHPFSSGIPQGSILGSLLFLLYIKNSDFPNSIMFFYSRLYADDTPLTASESSFDILLNAINSYLHTWLQMLMW